MAKEDPIGYKIKSVFEQAGTQDRAAEVTNNENLSGTEKKELAERLSLTLVGHPCHVCGQNFDAEAARNSIFIGPLGESDSAAYSHVHCFRQVLGEHPQMRETLDSGKKWRDFTDEEKQEWRGIFPIHGDVA